MQLAVSLALHFGARSRLLRTKDVVCHATESQCEPSRGLSRALGTGSAKAVNSQISAACQRIAEDPASNAQNYHEPKRDRHMEKICPSDLESALIPAILLIEISRSRLAISLAEYASRINTVSCIHLRNRASAT
jgi:hypothetical protein